MSLEDFAEQEYQDAMRRQARADFLVVCVCATQRLTRVGNPNAGGAEGCGKQQGASAHGSTGERRG
eukprot:scaffold2908_cov257-Pinguiococcus_pyrenoidosus.AAC.5